MDKTTRNRYRATFYGDYLPFRRLFLAVEPVLAVVQVPSHLKLPHCTTAAPYQDSEPHGAFPHKALLHTGKKLLSRMDMLSHASNVAPLHITSIARDAEIAYVLLTALACTVSPDTLMDGLSILRDLLTPLQKNLPGDLMMTPQSLKVSYAHGVVHEFVLLHMLINTMTVAAYHSSLFWKTHVGGNLIDYNLAVVGWSVSVMRPIHYACSLNGHRV